MTASFAMRLNQALFISLARVVISLIKCGNGPMVLA
jgi:hypothetical protein